MAVPYPVDKDIIPPVLLEPIPPVKTTAPPCPLLVLLPFPPVAKICPPTEFAAVVSPAVNMKSPPWYVVPEPIDTRTSPPLPLVAAPVLNVKCPDVPELVVPVENITPPLTPRVPAFNVRRTTAPLVVVVPCPDTIERAPPELIEDAAVLVPAVKRISAPPIPPDPDPADIIISPPLPPVAAPVANVIDPVVPLEEVPE